MGPDLQLSQHRRRRAARKVFRSNSIWQRHDSVRPIHWHSQHWPQSPAGVLGRRQAEEPGRLVPYLQLWKGSARWLAGASEADAHQGWEYCQVYTVDRGWILLQYNASTAPGQAGAQVRGGASGVQATWRHESAGDAKSHWIQVFEASEEAGKEGLQDGRKCCDRL